MKPRHEPSTHPHNTEAVFNKLRDSQSYQNYQTAFEETTGLAMTLAPAAPARGIAAEKRSRECEPNPFCSLIANGHDGTPTCSQCPNHRLRLYFSQPHNCGPFSLPCAAGLQHMAAPVLFGPRPVAYFVAGQFLTESPSTAELARMGKRLSSLGLPQERHREGLEAFAQSRVIGAGKHRNYLTLLAAYADRLSGLINPILLETDADAPEAVKLAVSLVDCEAPHEVKLDEVIARTEIPGEIFESIFENSVGICFGDYLARRRLERARRALNGLKSSSLTVAAGKAGCASDFELRSLFTDYLGETPEAYQFRMLESSRILKSWPNGGAPYYPLAPADCGTDF